MKREHPLKSYMCVLSPRSKAITEHNSEKNVHDDRDGPEWHNAHDDTAKGGGEASIEPSADCFCRNRLLLGLIFVIIWLLFQNWLLLSFFLLFDCFFVTGYYYYHSFYYYLNPLLTAFVVTGCYDYFLSYYYLTAFVVTGCYCYFFIIIWIHCWLLSS